MAQFDHYATWDDSFAMLREVFARGDIRAYLPRWHRAPPAPITSPTAELEAELRQSNGLYLAGSFSTHAPICYPMHDGDYAGQFYLREVGGGPLMSWLLANENVVDGRLTILPGMLGTSARYELEPGRFAPASPELKAAYADLQRRMKKHLVRWEGLWISPGALQLLRDGQAELPGALQPLGDKARAARDLPQIRPVLPVASQKRTRRPAAARTARAE